MTQRLWIGRALNGITSSSTGGSSSWPSLLLYFISRSSSSPWSSFLFSVSSTTLAPPSVFQSPHSFSTHDVQPRTHGLLQSPVGTRLPLSSKAQVHLHRGQPVVRLRQRSICLGKGKRVIQSRKHEHRKIMPHSKQHHADVTQRHHSQSLCFPQERDQS